jgi:hypothetical protein
MMQTLQHTPDTDYYISLKTIVAIIDWMDVKLW